ncbi:hypothetical protein [Hoyosella altamirensis]|uniref:Uncharacterized protein n=1 Tax=Hoyosella altamirensis TaxID=616997 RepID=A0A839RKI3_9ACTN|nr:hypothetical protein [Hoyosella altamirensis]MBB3036970.1 hypothetical protein [Hoyosella altamirensis]
MSRLPAVLLLLILGIFSLPVSAFFLDGPGTENWIVPVHFVVMGAAGALVAFWLPLAQDGASPGKRILVGASTGIGLAIVGLAVFWFLLNGIGGA